MEITTGGICLLTEACVLFRFNGCGPPCRSILQLEQQEHFGKCKRNLDHGCVAGAKLAVRCL